MAVLMSTHDRVGEPDQRADFAIVTALRDEILPVLAALGPVREVHRQQQDIRYYYLASVRCQDGTDQTVVCVLANEMGQQPALNATRDLIAAWKPRHLLLVGIAGGIGARGVNYGDLIVPRRVHYYEPGKLTPKGRRQRGPSFDTSARLQAAVEALVLQTDASWSTRIRARRPGSRSRRLPTVHRDELASGEEVWAHLEAATVREVLTRFDKVVAIENEAAGVFNAVHEAVHKPDVLVVKAASDLVDGKNDRWREFARHSAAAFAVALIEKVGGRWQESSGGSVGLRDRTEDENDQVSRTPQAGLPSVRGSRTGECLDYSSRGMVGLLPICESSRRNVAGDIVFVHGLDDDQGRTWRNVRGEFWPEWLAAESPNVAVWSLCYDSASSSWRDQAMPLYHRACQALAALKADGLGSRPICFVGHDMGGLLVKQMLRNADSLASEFRAICDVTRGIVFLASPHTSTDLVRLVSYLSSVLRLPATAQELQTIAAQLLEVNIWYRENVSRLRISNQVYFENYSTNGLIVVDRMSADIVLPGVTPIGIDADHIGICKPASKAELLYKRTKAFLMAAILTEPSELTAATQGHRSGGEAAVSESGQTNRIGLFHTFGQLLRSLRVQAGLSPTDFVVGLAQIDPRGLPVSEALFGRWETGDDGATPAQALRIAMLLRDYGLLVDRIDLDRFASTLGFRFDTDDLASLGVGTTSDQSSPDVSNSPQMAHSDQVSQGSGPVRDFGAYISDKVRNFVGREFVSQALDEFTQTNECGYFILEGEPGIGKTSFIAHLVQERGLIHHFNIASLNVRSASAFLENVCAQLASRYRVPQPQITPAKPADGTSLLETLTRVSATIPPKGQPCVLAIDALDESDWADLLPGTNRLFLPPILPRGVFIVVTQRPSMESLRIESPSVRFNLMASAEQNLDDVRGYLDRMLRIRQQLAEYLRHQTIDRADFILALTQKSAGNFMYLRFVLPEIEKGAYRRLDITHLPVGLRGYYDDHWARMRGLDERTWFEYRLRIIAALAAVREPVSAELLSKITGEPVRRVRSTLQQWRPFLKLGVVDGGGSRYRIYHESFQDYLMAKEEVADERVDLGAIHGMIAGHLWTVATRVGASSEE